MMDVTSRGCPILESRTPVVSINNQFRIQLTTSGGLNLIDKGRDAIETLARASTGSGTFVYRVRTIDKEHVVFKVAMKRHRNAYENKYAKNGLTKSEKILNGLKHEKKVYEMFTRLVTGNVTPFLLMGVLQPKTKNTVSKIILPENVLATETSSVSDSMSLSQYIRKNKLSYYRARTLIFQLVYTIEVLYRVGARHNDIHLGNVMMMRQPQAMGRKMRIIYLTRNERQEFQYDLPLYEWQPRIYDFDRVFKKKWPRMEDVRNNYAGNLLPKPVLNRFPWHDPKIDTADFNVTKVLQHIRNAANRNGSSQLKLAVTNITKDRSNLKGFVRTYKLAQREWFDYYLPVHRSYDKEQNITGNLNSPEYVIVSKLGPEFPITPMTPAVIANMRNLYR